MIRPLAAFAAVALFAAAVSARAEDGRALLQKGDYAGAAKAFEAAVKKDPKDPEARRGAAEALLGLGEVAKARTHAEEGLTLTSDKDAGLWLLLARTYLLEGDRRRAANEDPTEAYDDARAKAARSLKLDPKLAGARVVLGKALRMLDKGDEAKTVLEEALKQDPREFDALFESGELALTKLKEYAQAYDLYTRAAEADPKSAVAHLRRGTALAWLKRTDEALDAWGKAAVLDPSDKSALKFVSQHGMARTAEVFRTILKARPDHAWAHAYLAWTLAHAKDADGAMAEMKAAKAALPKDAALEGFRAEVLSVLGKADEAVAAALRALEMDPSVETAWSRLSVRAFDVRSGASRSEREDILKVLQKARPEDPVFWNNAGLYYRDTSRPKEALEAYLKAVALAPEDQGIQNDTGLIYLFHGKQIGEDPRKALPYFEKVVALVESDLQVPLMGYRDALENLAGYYGPPPLGVEANPEKALDYAQRRNDPDLLGKLPQGLGQRSPKAEQVRAWAESQLKK